MMAKAKKMVIPPKPVVEEYGVTLELTLAEAETLSGITERIGGPISGRRRHLIAIGTALDEAGVRGSITDDEVAPANRAIYFKEK
jgi:hypothetical protein